MSTNMVTVEL